MEQKRTKSLTGLFLMTGLILASLIWSYSYKQSKQINRTVSVRGLCTQEVKADRAICPLAYKVGGQSLQEVNKNMEKKNRHIIEFLKRAGITDKEISIATPEIVDTRTDWNDKKNPYKYIATAVVTACTDKVDSIIALQSRRSELIEKDIVTFEGWKYSTEYSFTKLNDIKPQMIRQATQTARLAAQQFADDSGSKLGKIKNAQQGQFSIEDRDENTPYIKNVRIVTYVNYYLND